MQLDHLIRDSVARRDREMRDDLTLIKLETFYAACELRVLFLGPKQIYCVRAAPRCVRCLLLCLVLLFEFVAEETWRQLFN
jgi:hypothetical protein